MEQIANSLEVEARKRDKNLKESKAQRELFEDEKNSNFVQIYPDGWKRLYNLIDNPTAAKIYIFLAAHIDGTGVVVVSQSVLAEVIGKHEMTIRRQTKSLEEQHLIARIKVGGGVYAYALDPKHVWKSWNNKKDYAVFNTRTLVKKSDKENQLIDRKLQVMLKEHSIKNPFLEALEILDEGESS